MEGRPKKDEIRIVVSGGYFIGEFEQNTDLEKVARADQDAYNLLFETLKVARESADFVVVLGNLFFLNNPSNETLTNTLSVFKESVLGDADIGIVVRKYDPNFANSRPRSAENLNVCMPVFAIHGGCDSPSAENLTSSLDIVHYSSYVRSTQQLNYVGKITDFEDIEIKPVYFEKGKTKLAIYFLGYIREVKLSTLLATNKIKFKKVDDSYFKILCVNQKRELVHTTHTG